jgi:hypothetical protein
MILLDDGQKFQNTYAGVAVFAFWAAPCSVLNLDLAYIFSLRLLRTLQSLKD